MTDKKIKSTCLLGPRSELRWPIYLGAGAPKGVLAAQVDKQDFPAGAEGDEIKADTRMCLIYFEALMRQPNKGFFLVYHFSLLTAVTRSGNTISRTLRAGAPAWPQRCSIWAHHVRLVFFSSSLFLCFRFFFFFFCFLLFLFIRFSFLF